MRELTITQKILELKKEKNAIILAHYYQEPNIQDIADFVGDSLRLSIEAAKTNADIIVFAGVYFMAETAKILNPTKKVLLPDLNAGCSLADSCPAEAFENFIHLHPSHTVITYVNCSAEVKALSDIICTSANAKKVIESLPKDEPIVFGPDKNLGKYLINETGRDLVLWQGACMVHEAFSVDKLKALSKQFPNAEIVAHPESETPILEMANYIGSTSSMINYIKKSDCPEFIIATEAGILHQMKKEVPGKLLIPAPAVENNTCACSECPYMKMNTLEKLYRCLRDETPEVNVPEITRKKALIPLKRMLEISA
jgi:quinolinate synthase